MESDVIRFFSDRTDLYFAFEKIFSPISCQTKIKILMFFSLKTNDLNYQRQTECGANRVLIKNEVKLRNFGFSQITNFKFAQIV